MNDQYRTFSKGIFCLVLVLTVFATSLTGLWAADKTPAGEEPQGKDLIKVYYFHTNYRCTTCTNMEKYTQEVIKANFAKELTQGKLLFSPVNVEEEANKHFVKDYKIYTKHVILSKVENGKEIRWKNLDQIWVLVRSPEKYKAYIDKEVRDFLDEQKGK